MAHEDETAYGKPGDPKKPARIVQIVMRESDGKMLFVPDRLEVRKGEQIRFQLRNNGERRPRVRRRRRSRRTSST